MHNAASNISSAIDGAAVGAIHGDFVEHDCRHRLRAKRIAATHALPGRGVDVERGHCIGRRLRLDCGPVREEGTTVEALGAAVDALPSHDVVVEQKALPVQILQLSLSA